MTYDTEKATALCARASESIVPLDLQVELYAAVQEIERQRAELTQWQEKCEARARELETAREEARRAEQARDEMSCELDALRRAFADGFGGAG